MKKAITNLKYWLQIFLIPLYLISGIILRNKKIWLCGSTFGYRFADNPKYFYLYLNQRHKKDIRAIWITKDKKIVKLLNRSGYEAYYYKSFKGIYFCLIGGVYIFDNYSKDISFWLSKGAMKVNLWHGIPLKKINHDNRFDFARNPRNLKEKLYYALRNMSDEKPSHYVLATSEFLHPIFKSAFKTNKVLLNGYPRNDNLIDKKRIENLYTKDEKAALRIISERKNDKVMLYMPTFRESEEKFFNVVDIDKLNIFFKQKNVFLCIKLHPKSKLSSMFDKIQLDNIYIIPSKADPYPFLLRANRLITDYSSIYFDYLLMDKPIIFFQYDYKEYIDNSREMYFDYDKFTPGRKVSTMNELMESICEEDSFKKERELIRRKVFQSNWSQCVASERLFNQIVKNK